MAKEKKDLTPESEKEGDVEETKTPEEETEEVEETETEEKEEKEEPSKPDYGTKLKREQELGKEVKDFVPEVEKTIAEESFKEREEKREGEEEEEKPLTKKELNAILAANRQQQRKEFLRESIADKVKKLTSNEEEAQLIIQIHKNRIFPEGLSLDEQLKESYAIANADKLLAKNEELQRSLRGKKTASDNAVGTHRDSPTLDEPKISSADIQAIKAAGFSWDGKSRLYIKQLAGGKKILTYDPIKKTRRVIEK